MPIAWWAPAWVPSAVAVWVYYAACLLWLVPFAWTVQWRRDPVEDEEPDEPGPRPVVVRGPGDGIDIGGGSDSFDYPDEDHHPRTPPPGWEPRSMVTGAAPVVGVFTDDEDEAGERRQWVGGISDVEGSVGVGLRWRWLGAAREGGGQQRRRRQGGGDYCPSFTASKDRV